MSSTTEESEERICISRYVESCDASHKKCIRIGKAEWPRSEHSFANRPLETALDFSERNQKKVYNNCILETDYSSFA